MSPSDILLAARDTMRDRGLAREALWDCDGSVCLLGALHLAESSAAELCEDRGYAPSAPYRALSDVCWERFRTIVSSSNNDHIRDLDEACDVLEAAAKRAAGEGS